MIPAQVDHPKTLFVSEIGRDARRYRCFHQGEQLTMLGAARGFGESDVGRLLTEVLDYDVFVLHRVPYSHLIEVIIDLAHLRSPVDSTPPAC